MADGDCVGEGYDVRRLGGADGAAIGPDGEKLLHTCLGTATVPGASVWLCDGAIGRLQGLPSLT